MLIGEAMLKGNATLALTSAVAPAAWVSLVTISARTGATFISLSRARMSEFSPG